MKLDKANQLLESVRVRLDEAPNPALTFQYMMHGEFKKIDAALERIQRDMDGVSKLPGVDGAVSEMERAILALAKARENLDKALDHAHANR